jgi:hypothetical protein
MKYLGLLLVALVISACYTVRPPVYTPEGDIACNKDEDCPDHFYCGFKKLDSRPVCRWFGWDQ